MSQPEIMSPVKNLASLEACKGYAHAVYFSVNSLSMRAGLDDIRLSNLGSFVKKCHSYQIKAYLVLNCVLYNDDLKLAEKVMAKAKQAKIDAVIVWDLAAIMLAKKHGLRFFISTQANISNYQTALFYKKLGASRVVLSREMTLKQIKELKNKVGKLEVETFVHGAMCYSISGRCLLSAYLYGQSANCGACAQPCRKRYILTDEQGKQIVNEGKYFLSAKDLCMIEHIPELIKAGIDSFKIEGRKRDVRYVQTTARVYREAVDSYYSKTFTADKMQQWKQDLTSVYNRGFSTGFYFGTPSKSGISYDRADNLSPSKKVLLGYVKHSFAKLGVASINFCHGGVKVGQPIIIEGKKTYLQQVVASLQVNGQTCWQVSKGQEAGLKVNGKVRVGDCVFVVK